MAVSFKEMFLFIISSILREFLVTDDNIEQLAKISMKTPIYALFHRPTCPHCRDVLPSWENFTHQNSQNSKVIIAQIDCQQYKEACNYFTVIYSFPSFAIIRNNKSTMVKTNRTIESWTKTVNQLENYDKDHRCQPWYGLTNDFPSFVVSAPYSPEKTCDHVLKLISKVPKSKGMIYTSANSDKLACEVFLSKDIGFIIENQTDTLNFVNFIQDFVMHPLGDWDISESIHSERIIGFFIYDKVQQLEAYRQFTLSNSGDILFGKIELSKFNSLYPEIKLNESEIPALGISNNQQTKFRILTNIKPYNDFYQKVINITKGEEIELMNHSMARIFGISEDALVGNSSRRSVIPAILVGVLCIIAFIAIYYQRSHKNAPKKLM